MPKKLDDLTTADLAQRVHQWLQRWDRVIADAVAMPGPGWTPVMDRFEREEAVVSAEIARRWP